MVNILNSTRYNSELIDRLAKTAFGNSAGVSTGPYGTIIHVPDGGNPETANELFAGIGALAVTTDKSTLADDGVDTATITCNAAAISGDAQVGYVVTHNGDPYSAGDAAVTAGVVELTLATALAGRYDVWLFRKQATYQSGSVVILAS